MLYDAVDLHEECIRIQQRDFELIKQVSVGLEEANIQLNLDLNEAKEERDQLKELLKQKERMWNDTINADLHLQHSINEKLLEKEQEIQLEKEKHEQTKQEINHLREDMHKELEKKSRIIGELEARIEVLSKVNAERLSAAQENAATATTGECENCRRQLETYQKRFQEQREAMASLEMQLFKQSITGTSFEVTTESTEMLQEKIDSLTKALKCMNEREVEIRGEIHQYCFETDLREKRNRAVSVLLAIMSLVLFLIVEIV